MPTPADIQLLTNLSGVGLAVGVLLFMMRYFMRREARMEAFLSDVLSKHTAAIQDNTRATEELRAVLVAAKIPRGEYSYVNND